MAEIRNKTAPRKPKNSKPLAQKQPKIDIARFKRLNEIYANLLNFDDEVLDDLGYDLSSAYFGTQDEEAIDALIENLKKRINEAIEIVYIESNRIYKSR